MILSIDPGTAVSSYVVYDGVRVLDFGDEVPNAEILDRIRAADISVVCEDVQAMGMSVGAEVFVTVRWSGRFEQRCADLGLPWHLLKRTEIKLHLCGTARAKDPNVHQALLDRFGPGKDTAVGRKASPGPLYGVKGHCWSALAVAVTWWDRTTQ